MSFNPGILALLIPIIALTIPIVAILAAHQQKMAQIFREGAGGRNPHIDALAAEVQRLQDVVNQQQITIDNLAQTLPRVARDPSLESRIGGDR
jgi:hypothetical protein